MVSVVSLSHGITNRMHSFDLQDAVHPMSPVHASSSASRQLEEHCGGCNRVKMTLVLNTLSEDTKWQVYVYCHV